MAIGILAGAVKILGVLRVLSLSSDENGVEKL